jgi:hypothetical protein
MESASNSVDGSSDADEDNDEEDEEEEDEAVAAAYQCRLMWLVNKWLTRRVRLGR